MVVSLGFFLEAVLDIVVDLRGGQGREACQYCTI